MTKKVTPPPLLPCPVCGRSNPMITTMGADNPYPEYQVYCDDINSHNLSIFGKTKIIAIKRWNNLPRKSK